MRKLVWHLSRTTLWSGFALLLLLAVATLAGRLLIHKIDDYRVELAQQLSQQLGASVQIGKLKARWQGRYPVLLVEGVQLDAPRAPSLIAAEQPLPLVLPALALDQLQLKLDLWQSLKSFQPVVRRLEINGVRLRLEQWESGTLTLAGFTPGPTTAVGVEEPLTGEPIWQQLLEPLLLQRQLSLQGLEVKLMTRSGASRWLSVPTLDYQGGGWKQKLQAQLQFDDNPEISLALNRRGDPGSLEPGRLQGYLDWPEQSLGLWMELLPGGDAVERLQLGGRFWLEHRSRQWRIQGEVSLPGFDLRLPGELPAPRMAHLATDFTLLLNDQQNWQLWLEQLQGRVEGVELAPEPIYLRGRPEGVQLAIAQLDLEPFKQVALAYPAVPATAQALLGTLNPVGQLHDISLFIDPEQPEQFELSAKVLGAGVDAWESAPSARNASGQLRMRGAQGEFLLDSSGLSLGLTELFDAPWQWTRAQGRLFWFVEDQRFTLLGRGLKVDAPIGQVNGELRLDFPFDERPDEMGLLLAIENADAGMAGRYIPGKILSAELNSWLDQALQSGRVSDGVFLYNGVISDGEPDSAHSYDMYYRAQDVVLDYAPPWPRVEDGDALVKVTNNRVDVQVAKGSLLDQGQLESAHVWFDGDPAAPKLHVEGQLRASGGDGLRVLQESPLAEVLEGVADGWKIDGHLQVGLNLAIGLAEEVEDDLQVQVTTQELDLYLDQADLNFKDLLGEVRYDSKNGLSSNNLQGQLFGQHTRFAISGREGGRFTRIEARGQVGARALQTWQGFDWLGMAKGQSAYQAVLDIRPQRAPRLQVNTDLRGMALDLPAYFYKTARTARPSRIALTLDNPLLADFSLGNNLHGRFEISADGVLERGRFRAGAKGTLQLPARGLHLDGRFSPLSIPKLQRWYQQARWLEPQTTGASSGTALSPLYVDRLRIDELEVDNDLSLKPLTLTVAPQDSGYRIEAESPALAGQLWYPGDSRRWRLALTRLHLPEPAAEPADQKKAQVDPLADLNPATLPQASVTVDDLRLGSRMLGRLKAEVKPHPKGVHLFNIGWTMPHLDVKGDLSWNYENRLHGTTSKLQFSSDDISALIKSLGYEPGAQARSSTLALDLFWPGSPLAISAQSMRGTANMEMQRGRFVELDPKANVLKIFGVLNFGSITRRLQLDFSDLFEEGIAFDRVKAKLRTDQGRVTTTSPLTIDGPSSSFRMNGWYDLQSNRTDMRLAVTLPVTQNLPVIAILMGLPQVGGAIFLADKLLGDSVQRFASVRYRIHGDLDEPKVDFDKAFTNKTD